MAFENIHNLEAVRDVSKEDDIALIREASNVRAKLTPGSADFARKRCEFVTFCAEPRHEVFTCGDAAAGVGDVGENVEQVGAD